MSCLYLGESFLGTLVEFQFHHIDSVGSLQRDIYSALRRMLLHNNICNSLYKLYYVCRMYAEEDNKDLLSFAL